MVRLDYRSFERFARCLAATGTEQVPQNVRGTEEPASDQDQARVLLYVGLALVPCLALVPFLLSSGEMVPADIG